MNAQIYIKVGLGWDGWMENSQITPYFFFPALPSVWTVALVDFVLTKPSAVYSCFPAAEIQCLDLASTHRQSALLHFILALRWVAHCCTLLHTVHIVLHSAHHTCTSLSCTLHSAAAAIRVNFTAIFGIPPCHCFRSLSGVAMATDTNATCL